MLRAYFDAGLKLKPPQVYYVAGYVGRHDGWTRFNSKWRDLLRRNDLPYFHMTTSRDVAPTRIGQRPRGSPS